MPMKPRHVQFIPCIAFLLLGAPPSLARPNEPYFPDLVFSEKRDNNNRFVEWYSKHLRAMDEPPLWKPAKQSRPLTVYRFLWLPAFHRPEAIRIVKDGDETILHLVQLDGKGGYEPGKVAVTKNVKLTQEQWDELSSRISKVRFWELPTDNWKTVIDGAAIVIEGVKDGKYHVIHANLGSEDQHDMFFKLIDTYEFAVNLSGFKNPE